MTEQRVALAAISQPAAVWNVSREVAADLTDVGVLQRGGLRLGRYRNHRSRWPAELVGQRLAVGQATATAQYPGRLEIGNGQRPGDGAEGRFGHVPVGDVGT